MAAHSEESPSAADGAADALMDGATMGWAPESIRPGLVIRTATAAERLSGLRLSSFREKGVAFPTSSSQPSRDSQVSYASDSTRLSRADSVFSVSTPRLSHSPVRHNSVDSEPVSAISPWCTEQPKDSLDPANRYFCTFCDQSFGSEADWRSHQVTSHGDGKKYFCRDCGASYSLLTSLSAHLQQAHGATPLPAEVAISEPSGTTRTWGCGFCATALSSHIVYLDHLAKHFDDGKEQIQWQHLSVIKALLHQPGLRDAWERLVDDWETSQGQKLRFLWDDQTSLVLQSMLERFSIGKDDPRVLAGFAYHTAQVKAEANVTGKYTTDGRSSQVQRPAPNLDNSVQTSRGIPARPGVAMNFSDMRRPGVLVPQKLIPAGSAPVPTGRSAEPSASFSSHNAKKSTQPTAAPTVLAKIEETTVSQPGQVLNLLPQRSLLGTSPRDSSRQGLLRRVESDWNLGPRLGPSLSPLDETPIPRPRTALASRSTRPSVNITTNSSHHDATSTSLLPTPSELTPDSHTACEEWLMISKPKTSSSRSPSGSSFVSSPTMEHARLVDNSTTDGASDDSLSEPDLWFNLNDKSESTRVWAHALHHTVDGLMRHIWTCYNQEWDALINTCVGEQSGSQSHNGEFTPKGTTQGSTYYTTNRGLMPNIRRQYADEKDEDDDLEGHRPPSSQSRNSSSAPKRYACPFRKHDPVVYNIHDHDICALRSWESVSRMKEHLYRKHCKVHCQRCKQVFRRPSELASHAMRPEGCQLRGGNGPADISVQKELQLKSKKYASRYQTEEEKWREVYRLLFPGEHIPSPYPELAPDIRPPSAESQNSITFQHFLVSEMPQFFRQTAESHYGRHIEDHDSLTMDSINFIISESVNKAFQEWEARGNPVPRHATPNSLIQESSIDPSPSMPMATPDLGQTDLGQFIPHALLVSDFQPQPPPNAYWPPGDPIYGLDVPRMPPTSGDPGFTFGLDDASYNMTGFQSGYNTGPWV